MNLKDFYFQVIQQDLKTSFFTPSFQENNISPYIIQLSKFLSNTNFSKSTFFM